MDTGHRGRRWDACPYRHFFPRPDHRRPHLQSSPAIVCASGVSKRNIVKQHEGATRGTISDGHNGSGCLGNLFSAELRSRCSFAKDVGVTRTTDAYAYQSGSTHPPAQDRTGDRCDLLSPQTPARASPPAPLTDFQALSTRLWCSKLHCTCILSRTLLVPRTVHCPPGRSLCLSGVLVVCDCAHRL